MNVRVLGNIKRADDGFLIAPIPVGRPPKDRIVDLPLPLAPDEVHAALNAGEPYLIGGLESSSSAFFAFRGKLVQASEIRDHSTEEVALEVANVVLGRERRYRQLRRHLDAFKNMERADTERRERIPAEIRLFVWQRDQGRCVTCGSSERLEFDHVIPIAKGGGNTERNIQLMCEQCNRRKGVNI